MVGRHKHRSQCPCYLPRSCYFSAASLSLSLCALTIPPATTSSPLVRCVHSRRPNMPTSRLLQVLFSITLISSIMNIVLLIEWNKSSTTAAVDKLLHKSLEDLLLRHCRWNSCQMYAKVGRWFDKPRGSSVRNNILQVDDVYIVGHFAIQLAALNGGRDWIDCRHITERNVRNVSLAESTGSPAALHYSTQRPWPAALKTLFSLAARSQVSRERLQQQFRSRLIIQMRLARPCLFPYFSPFPPTSRLISYFSCISV